MAANPATGQPWTVRVAAWSAARRWPVLLLAIALLVVACGSDGNSATPRPSASQAPTQLPTAARIVGSGVIRFGHDYDPASLSIIRGSGRFRTTEAAIAWRAEFSEAANASSVVLLLAAVSATGAESVIETLDVAVAHPDFNLLASKADLATLAKHRAGTYVLRYIRDGTVLAEGRFKLVK